MTKLYELLPWRKTAQSAVKRADDYSAHLYLGNMHLAMGQTDQAAAEYARAHAIRPSEQTEKLLASIRCQCAAQRQSGDSRIPVRRAA